MRNIWFILIFPWCVFGFSFETDTIYFGAQSHSYSDTIIINRQSDSIKIDSIRVRTIVNQIGKYVLSLDFTNKLSNRLTVCGFELDSNNQVRYQFQQGTLIIEPHAIVVASGCLNGCCVYLVKSAIASSSPDSLLMVNLIFYTNTGVDSLVIVNRNAIPAIPGCWASIQREKSYKQSKKQPLNSKRYDLAGKYLNADNTRKVEIQKGSKRVVIGK